MDMKQAINKVNVEAETFVKASYAEMIHEAQTILEQAYQMKEQIIQESEPFLN